MKRIYLSILLLIGCFSVAQDSLLVATLDSIAKKDTIVLETFITAKEPSAYKFLPYMDEMIRQLKKDPVLKNANWGFCLYNPTTQESLIEKDANRAYLPASTTKLISSEAALYYLGGDYQWKTQVYYSGEIDSLGTLKGNVQILYNGDPSIGLGAIKAKSFFDLSSEVYSALQLRGIKKLNGNIIAESVVFKKDEKYYNIDKNFINFGDYYSVIPSKNHIAKVSDEDIKKGKDDLEVTNNDLEAISEEEDPEEAIINQIIADLQNSIRLANLKEIGIKNTMLPNPPSFFGNKLKEFLAKKKFTITGKVLTQDYKSINASERRNLLINYDSPPLRDLVYFTNQRSSNFYADHLLRTVGYIVGKEDTQQNSLTTVKKHLQETGFDFNGFAIADGSGLSRSNWVTPISQVKFLTYTMKQSYFKDYYHSLPSAGESGTLVSWFASSPLRGNVHAKTGTLNKVKALSGFIDAPNGERLVFSFLVNSYSGSVDSAKNRMRKLLETILQY